MALFAGVDGASIGKNSVVCWTNSAAIKVKSASDICSVSDVDDCFKVASEFARLVESSSLHCECLAACPSNVRIFARSGLEVVRGEGFFSCCFFRGRSMLRDSFAGAELLRALAVDAVVCSDVSCDDSAKAYGVYCRVSARCFALPTFMIAELALLA